MHNIEHLLKEIRFKKSEIQTIVEDIYQASGVLLQEHNITIVDRKGMRQIRIQTSGAKKTVLILKQSLIQERLDTHKLTIVL